VAVYGRGEVVRIDPATSRVAARIRLGGRAVGTQARAVLLAAGSVRVANQGSGTVVRVAGS
jgi:hypothetical protein